MKMILKYWLLVAIGGVLLGGCGGGGGDSSAESGAPAGGVSASLPAAIYPDDSFPGDDSPAYESPDQGYPDTDELLMVLETEFDPHWSAVGVYSNAADCGSCHRASRDGSGVMRLPQSAAGTDISPWAGWGHSMMAQSWSDPYFQASVEGQAFEFPDYAGDIEDKCLSCHSPMAHSHAHDTGLGLVTSNCPLGGECYRMETSAMQNHAREGVSCTLCHQMVADADTEPGSGNYLVAREGDDRARVIYGPYQNPKTRPMQNNTEYSVEQGDYISSSEHCGSCHDLDTPTFDVNTGHPAEPAIVFREQAAYAEWLNSSYGEGGSSQHRSCQACHMQGPEAYQTAIAVNRSGAVNPSWPQRSPFSLHDIAGGNTYVLGLLKNWRKELGIEASTTAQGFDAAIAKGREILGQAAEVALSAPVHDAGQLQLAVQITNKSGHKLPTGYPSRRMWLQLTLSNAQGEVLFESGRADENGFLAVDGDHLGASCLATDKSDGFINSPCYQQHQDEITAPGQVAIYEAVMADTNRHINYSLLYSASYLKDNRIPPRGFSSLGENYDVATAIVGQASADNDFNREQGRQGSGRDTVHYRIALPDDTSGSLLVAVRLWYQSIAPAYIAAIAHRGDKSDRLRIMVQQQPPVPELLAMDSQLIDL